MRVVVAVRDEAGAEWLVRVLQQGGYSVALVPDLRTDSPELHGAEVLIADREQTASVGDGAPRCRILFAPRGGTVELTDLEKGFADVIAMPSAPDEVLARVEHAVRRTA